eukprot:4813765-Prymnesium_polylepis.1
MLPLQCGCCLALAPAAKLVARTRVLRTERSGLGPCLRSSGQARLQSATRGSRVSWLRERVVRGKATSCPVGIARSATSTAHADECGRGRECHDQ